MQATDKDTYQAALRLLTRREHSQAELITKLMQRGHEHTDIENVLTRLQTEGLQSDERFVQAYVRSRSERGMGPTRIRQELQQRGINEELLAAVDINAQDTWEEQIAAVYRKKFKDWVPITFAERAKCMRFLQYRGFTTEQINKFLIYMSSS